MPRLPTLLLLLLCAAQSAANTPSPERLQQLKQQISELSESLADSHQQRSEVNESLRQLDLRIGKLSKQQRQLQGQLKHTRQQQHQLQAKQQRLLDSKQQQVEALVKLLRQRYHSGRQLQLKLLLNQQQPERLARQLAYQSYFEKARSQQINALSHSLEQLAALSQQLLNNQQQLEQQQQSLAAKQQALKSTQTEREALLANINHNINNKQDRLIELKANKSHLQQLLEQMRAAISDIPANLGETPFSQLANELPWPLPGPVTLEVGYRDLRAGVTRWDGVVLEADTGDPVRAIYPGRVIYADWLPGYGLMIIVDQGHGYMTLYGYNRNITRAVGDWVAAGDIIAHVGNSGGRREPGLYFGVRHHGRPSNPDHWCNGRVALPNS